MWDDLDRCKEERERYVRRRRAKIAAVCDDEFLGFLEERFETNLPVFQGKAGEYDPLDAMRRDAYREVVLFLREERGVYEQEQQQRQ